MEKREKLQDFLITGMVNVKSAEISNESILRSINKLGLNNSAVYIFDEPFEYSHTESVPFPDHIRLYCVIKSGDMYVLAKERQSCLISEIFTRNELSLKCRGFAVFPIFYSCRIYGIMLCELTNDIFKRGEFIALELGRSFYINELEQRLQKADR